MAHLLIKPLGRDLRDPHRGHLLPFGHASGFRSLALGQPGVATGTRLVSALAAGIVLPQQLAGSSYGIEARAQKRRTPGLQSIVDLLLVKVARQIIPDSIQDVQAIMRNVVFVIRKTFGSKISVLKSPPV